MDIVSLVMAITMGILLISMLGMASFALKNVFTGRHEWQKLVSLFVPFLIFLLALVFTSGDSASAGILTVLGMLGLLVIFVVLTGLKKTFKF
jgi:hypothetical protein